MSLNVAWRTVLNDRWQSASDIRLELDWAGKVSPAAEPTLKGVATATMSPRLIPFCSGRTLTFLDSGQTEQTDGNVLGD